MTGVDLALAIIFVVLVLVFTYNLGFADGYAKADFEAWDERKY